MGQGLPDKVHNARLSLEFQINSNFSISLSLVLQILSWDTVKKCLELNKSSSQPVTDGELMGKDPSSFAPWDNSEAVSCTLIPRIPWGDTLDHLSTAASSHQCTWSCPASLSSLFTPPPGKTQPRTPHPSLPVMDWVFETISKSHIETLTPV